MTDKNHTEPIEIDGALFDPAGFEAHAARLADQLLSAEGRTIGMTMSEILATTKSRTYVLLVTKRAVVIATDYILDAETVNPTAQAFFARNMPTLTIRYRAVASELRRLGGSLE